MTTPETAFLPLVWDSSMSVGLEPLDQDHRMLIGLLSKLMEAGGEADVRAVFTRLQDYTIHHFAREEAAMAAAGCPNLAFHQRTHRTLAALVTSHRERFEAGEAVLDLHHLIRFFRDWLRFHILRDDMAYKPYMIGHEGALAAVAALPFPEE